MKTGRIFIAALMLLFSCSVAVTSNAEELEPPAEGMAPIRYDCGRYGFSAQFGGDEARFTLPRGHVVLYRVPSDKGVRYRGKSVSFWTDRRETVIEVNEAVHRGCVPDRVLTAWETALVRGVAFRAIGGDPAWVLEVEPKRKIQFTGEQGKLRITTAAPQKQSAPEGVFYQAKAGADDLTMLIEQAHCSDIRTGEAFTSKVAVTLAGRAYSGCGRWLYSGP